MSERCKTCRKEFESGIWIAPQFKDEGVLLFCSDKCRDQYLEMKLRRIKEEYPKHYDQLIKSTKKTYFSNILEEREKEGK